MLSSITDLIAEVDADRAQTGFGLESLEPFPDYNPLLVILAGRDGGLIAADSVDSNVHLSEARDLAADLSACLAERKSCVIEHRLGGRNRMTAALRVPGRQREVIVGAALPVGIVHEQADDFTIAAIVVAALASVCGSQGVERHRLRVGLEHLRAQMESLRVSHAEALTAATEEREERLREQEDHVRQLQAIMMMAADGIVTVDEEGIIESFNEAAGSIFGYAPREVIGRNISLLIPSADCELRSDSFTHGLRTREGTISPAREIVGRRMDGTNVPLDLSTSAVCTGNRRIVTGIFRDITERKKAEEELRRLHLQNELILNSAAEGIVGVNRDGKFMFVNASAAFMLGWDVAELVGRPIHATIHHSQIDGRPFPSDECFLPCRPHWASATDEILWRKDGTSFPAECTSIPIRERGEVTGAVITFRDISERQALETQLRQAQKLESIGQLAAGIAHEINTPTQYIGDNLRFLQEAFSDLDELLTITQSLAEADDGNSNGACSELRSAVGRADVGYLLREIPTALSQSLEGVERVANIVRSMKEFSHPNGQNFQAIDLNRAIESTLTVSRNEWKYVAELETDLASDLPLVTCLPGDINQVLLNLIVNAAHAIGERVGDGGGQKGELAVRTRQEGEWIEICVEDNGSGIPPEIRSRIFDPFFTTKPVGRGTGQGLAICHSIVTEKHHGTITFESDVGRGTSFIVRLPVTPRTIVCGD